MTTSETLTQNPGQHGLVAHSHGGEVPVQTRSERLKSFEVTDFPAISRREEQWRYTTSEQLAGLDSDKLKDFEGSVSVKHPPEVKSSWVARDHDLVGIAGKPEDRPSAAAWSSVSKAFLVTIPSDSKEDCEVQIAVNSDSADPSALHIIVHAEPGSQGTVIIDHKGSTVLSENLEIIVGDNANLTVVSIQDWNDRSVHASAQFAKIGRSAKLKHLVVSLGGSVVRVTPSARFAEPGSEVNLLGLYFADAGQHLEHRLFVDHAVPNCKSRVTYKGALQGKNAHTIWVGDVLIRAAAQGTDTYELNRNLLLTDGARADSVPNLEIETGQIQGAGHASASGRFDDDQLFYLQARGISELEARRLVVRGFLNEIIQQIDNPEVQARLTRAIEDELARSNS